MAQKFCIGYEKLFQALPRGFISGLYLLAAHTKRQDLLQLSDIPKGFVPFLKCFRQRVSGLLQITVLLLNVPRKQR